MFPRAERRFESFQPGDLMAQRSAAHGLRTTGDLMLNQQEPHEPGGIDRCDLPPQPIQRQPMNPRQQPPFTPLKLVHRRRELPAQNDSREFQLLQGDLNIVRRHAQVVGKRASGRRPHNLHPPAYDGHPGFIVGRLGTQCLRQCGGRIPIDELQCRIRERPPFDRQPNFRPSDDCPTNRATALDQFLEERSPSTTFPLRQRPGRQQCIVQFVRTSHERPGFLANLGNRLGIEPPQIAHVVGAKCSAHGDGPCPSLLQGRIVEKRIYVGVDELMTERRWFSCITSNKLDASRFNILENAPEPRQIHDFGETITHSLPYERMIRRFQIAGAVFEAGCLHREHRGEQIFSPKPLQMRRHPLSAALPQHAERSCDIPPPANTKHRCSQESLNEHRLGDSRVEEREHLLEREALLRTHGEHDAIVIRAGLQFEIECAAEALPQCKPPGTVDSSAKWRVNHKLHAARLIEEPLENNLPLGRHSADRRAFRRHVIRRLLRGPFVRSQFGVQPHGSTLDRYRGALPNVFSQPRQLG